MSSIDVVAPAFIDMAHRIVWATVATVGPTGQPRTRVLHPIWEFDGERLTGWIATSPGSPKAADLANESRISVTYWDPQQDTCTADCDTVWEREPARLEAGWKRFENAPEPVGYDPAMIPGWTSPDVDAFGILRLTPTWLRVFPGSVLMGQGGEVLTWQA